MTEITDSRNGQPERRKFQQGTTIFKEGERADTAYILESGKVQIFKMIGGRRIQLGSIKPWGIFGELGLIDDSPRMAAAMAAEDCVCLLLTKDNIEAMLDEAPQGLRVLVSSMAATIRTAGEDLAQARAQLLERQPA